MESVGFLGITISQDLKRHSYIDSIVKKAQQRLYSFVSWESSTPQELLEQFTFHHWIRPCTSIPVWFSSATKSDHRRLWRVVRTAERIIGTTPHSPRTLLIQSELKGWQKTQDTGTVSSLKQSISWTLDNNYGTHTIYTLILLIYLTHI